MHVSCIAACLYTGKHMIDPRFHDRIGALPFAELARRAGHSELALGEAADVEIGTVADLADAAPDALSFIARAQYRAALAETRAAVVLADPKLDIMAPTGVHLVRCTDPYDVFIDMVEVLFPDATRSVARRSAMPANVDSYLLEDGVVLGRGVVIGAGAQIGRDTVLGPNVVIGAGVTIGRNCVIGAGCVIECAHLGNGVVLQPGVVIGGEGFGFTLGAAERKKIPQLGRVIIQDGVELGANTTVDRGTLIDTVIGEGSKIDNLVQIGHNCRIGRNCVISGTSALGGSTVLEDGVIMGGGVKTSGHLTLGAGTIVLAGSGVIRSFPAGSNIGGTPAQDAKAAKRELAALKRLVRGEKA